MAMNSHDLGTLVLSAAGIVATFWLGMKNCRLTGQHNLFTDALQLNKSYQDEIARLTQERDTCLANLEQARAQRNQARHEAATAQQRLNEERELFDKKLAQLGQQKKGD
jgi:hypothetical protein